MHVAKSDTVYDVFVCVYKKKRRGKIRTMFMFAYFGRAFLYMLKSWQKSVVQR